MVCSLLVSFFVDPSKEDLPVVQLACDKGMQDFFPGAAWEPFKNLPPHLQGMEACGGDGIDLGGHVEFAVDDNHEVRGRGGCQS